MYQKGDTHIGNSALQSYGELFIVALDIAKAFDRFGNPLFWANLLRMDLVLNCASGLTISFQRNIQVSVDGHLSILHKINAGVPQGSEIAPTHFLYH